MKNLSWFKRNRNILRVIAINILLIFIGLESISLGFYLIENHQLYYTRGQNQDTKIVKNLEQAGINLDQSIIQRLHPFFGYVIKPGNYPKQFSVSVNRHGFLTPYEYPFIRSNSNQFIVGVFGGSVASIFAVNDNVSQGFTKKLKNFPDLANKEIIVMDFASGGYKQPQQLLILNYFLAIGQTFDVVINIDGFNEVALSNLNNQGQIDISMPSIQHIQPLTGLANNTLSLDLMSLVVKIQQAKMELKTAVARLDSCKLALCHALTSLQINQLISNYRNQVTLYDQKVKVANSVKEDNSILYIPKNNAVLDDTTAFEKIASNWYESSILMNQILISRKIKYFHFLQPNQYYLTKHVFSEKEREIALNKNSAYAEGVKKGYPTLLAKIDDLRKAKVNIFNGVNIFDDTQEIVYTDDCCHYNATGEEILFSYVANTIIQSLQEY